MDEDNNIVVTWKYDDAAQHRIRGFQLERRRLERAGYESASGIIGPDARSCKDPVARDQKQGKVAYLYHVKVYGKDGGFRISKDRAFSFWFAPPPPRPTGLKARLFQKDKEHYVHLTWEKATDDVTRSYRLFQGRVGGQLLGIGRTDANEFTRRVVSLNDAMYRFAVAGNNELNQEGPQASVDVDVPGINMPDVPLANYTWDQKVGSEAHLTWTYPKRQNLKGFRLHVGDTEVTEDVLGPDVREYKWKTDKHAFSTFTIVAVSDTGRVSGTKHFKIDLSNWPKDKKPPMPSDLTAEWVEKDDTRKILLKWKLNTDYPEAVAGYFLSVDEKEVGGDYTQKKDNLIKDTEYIYEPPDPDRSYHLHVSSVSRHGKVSSSTNTVLLLKPGAVLPPAEGFWYTPFPIEASQEPTVKWRYPQMPNLKGFRIYVDGNLVKDDKEITKDMRETKLPKIQQKGYRKFTLEAIPVEGPPSERGPATLVLVR